ncbi:glycosyltransferase family 2 protein [Altericroceibacterium endophyticum]|uniref:Glycosyltransferase n=1 Tax=Altericroceibacterium endophyticum TaxID=1808508 RepID=A0A6I4T8J4_9SPHN|nr:glycosyltransferase [Altericroceibacterium endophyticum]MXO66343.1 glycosyltransferase [Altericroceibacterium endophyticum]
MNTPRISVVMPVYNVEAYIGAAIESVLAQSFEDFELIIVDDGGSDNSIEIARSYDDPRIHIVSQINRGLAGARNTGIAAAQGDYIALLDSDDCYHPDKLRLHFVHLEANRMIGVSYAGSRMIDAEGNPLSVAMRPKLTGIDSAQILRRNPIGNGSAAVLRRSAIDRAIFNMEGEPYRRCWFDESFRQSEDIEFWIRLSAKHGVLFEGIEGLLTDYRIVAGALSANIVKQYLSWNAMLRKTREYAPELIARHGHQARAYQLRYLSRRAVQLGDAHFAKSLLSEALTTSPRIAFAEPIKTGVTGAAVLAANILGPERFRRVATRYLKGAVA